MITADETAQIEHLKELQRKLYWDRAMDNTVIVIRLGDVPALTTYGGSREIVAVDGFDGWDNGSLKYPDMTATEAMDYLQTNGEKNDR